LKIARLMCAILYVGLVGCVNSVSSELIPLRYESIAEKIVISKGGAPFQIARDYKVRYEPAKGSNKYASLLPTNNVERRYVGISATVLNKEGASQPLLVKLFDNSIKDLSGKRFTLTTPKIILPLEYAGEVVSVHYEMALSSNLSSGNSYSLRMPLDAPVNNANISILSEDPSVRIESFGFTLIRKSSSRSGEEQYFESTSPSSGHETMYGSAALEISTFSDWSRLAGDIATKYSQELEKKIDVSEVTKSMSTSLLSHESALDESQIAERSIYLFKWMHKNFAYSAQGFDPKYGIAPRPIEQTWIRRNGDCKDSATLYLKLLAQVGVQAEPVLVAISDNGPDGFFPNRANVPSLGLFNHVIVYIPQIDAYVDVTGFPEVPFGSWSARYANSNGLHLFSSTFRTMKPGIFMKSIKTLSHITKRTDGWVGTTNWKGEGWGQVGVALTGNLITANKEKNPSFFEHNKMSLKPASWRTQINEQQGSIETSFSYIFQENLANQNGYLSKLPFNASTTMHDFYSHTRLSLEFWGCFAKEYYEDQIIIEDVSVNPISQDDSNIDINGENTKFNQRIEFSNQTIRITRSLTVDEPRAHCSNESRNTRNMFYQKIKEQVLETNKKIARV
jgi:hypothetical protein